MTPAHTDSPLRRSEAVLRDGAQNQHPQHNDDEEERLQSRRRTLLNASAESTASILEQSETLKKCLEIFHENKLSRDNAWSLSLIDTVSSLLERHHKSLNNFSVCGSSLEASSKVYGLRVDSVHTDVLRMSAGLNARKFRENANEDDDGVATGGEGGADPNSSAATGVNPEAEGPNAAKKRKQKRTRKAVSTVTKNKETLNARLDTVPMQDPVFGKLNSIVGSINSSNRLMNNMLYTVDSELRLHVNHKFWNNDSTDEKCDYTIPVPADIIMDMECLPCERLCKFERFENRLLRPMESGYIISDTPEPSVEQKDDFRCDSSSSADCGGGSGAIESFPAVADSSMAFDINGVCDPMPELNAYATMVAVDEQDYDDFTADEHNAISNCRGLRKMPVVIEDMRPVDSTTNLEYSYRPVEKISQFWAGPSHWRFRRTQHRPSAMGSSGNYQQTESVGRALNARNRRQNLLQSKKRLRVEFAAPIHDAQFIRLDEKFKARRANCQKKWDQRKLRLPTDLQLNAEKLIGRRYFAPAFLPLNIDKRSGDDDGTDPLESHSEDQHFNMDDEHNIDSEANNFNATHGGSALNEFPDHVGAEMDCLGDESQSCGTETNLANGTILEIATDFENAPRQITKIIVPFAKRAKVIDMKALKRTCSHLVTQKMRECRIPDTEMPQHPIVKGEHYAPGLASFKEIYKSLPALLTPVLAEGLTTSIALYSVLHLSNDLNFRLIPQDDLEDFKIRQIIDR